MSESTYILSVPETGATREVTGEQLRDELARGEITSAHWVWSPEHGDWKQISELPTLWAAPAAAIPVPAFLPVQAAPEPAAAMPVVGATTGLPLPVKAKVAVIPGMVKALPVKAMPRSEPNFTPAAVPVAAVPVRKKKLINTGSVHVEYESFPWVKFAFEALYILVAVVIGLNYIVVDKPLNETLSHTSFVLVPVHAHMGSFVQPNAMVVHLMGTKELNNDNLPDFLQTLAASTPNQPFNADQPFQIIELTSGWMSQYSIPGASWKKLAGMSKESMEDRRDYIADSLCTISGQPMISHAARQNPIDLKTARDNTWRDFSKEMLRGS